MQSKTIEVQPFEIPADAGPGDIRDAQERILSMIEDDAPPKLIEVVPAQGSAVSASALQFLLAVGRMTTSPAPLFGPVATAALDALSAPHSIKGRHP